MHRPQPKADLAENLLRTHDALWRRARATHNALVDTTWAQLIRACGFAEGTPVENARRSVRRYLELLAEAGLINWAGHKAPSGQWKCLHIELREPPATLALGRSSSAGRAAFACEARRLKETPQQTAARRRKPWRRCGGRRDAVARHSLLWSLNVPTPSSETAPDEVWGRSSRDGHARPRVGEADATSARAQAQRNGGDEEEGAGERRQARRQRRTEARAERLRAETRRMIRDGDLVPRWQRAVYAAADGDADAERELYGRFADFLAAIPKDAGP